MRTLIICLIIILFGFADSFAQTSVPIHITDTTTQEYPISKHGTPGIPTGTYYTNDHGDKFNILRGPRGGLYYLTPNNTKRYIHLHKHS